MMQLLKSGAWFFYNLISYLLFIAVVLYFLHHYYKPHTGDQPVMVHTDTIVKVIEHTTVTKPVVITNTYLGDTAIYTGLSADSLRLLLATVHTFQAHHQDSLIDLTATATVHDNKVDSINLNYTLTGYTVHNTFEKPDRGSPWVGIAPGNELGYMGGWSKGKLITGLLITPVQKKVSAVLIYRLR